MMTKVVGNQAVKPLEALSAEVAITSETMAMPRKSQSLFTSRILESAVESML